MIHIVTPSTGSIHGSLAINSNHIYFSQPSNQIHTFSNRNVLHMPHALHFACMTYFCTVFFLLLYLRSLSCRFSCYSFSSFSSIFRSTTLSIHTYVTAFNTVPCGWKIHHLPVCVHTKKHKKLHSPNCSVLKQMLFFYDSTPTIEIYF